MGREDIGLQAWVVSNLHITHRQLSLEQARRWQRLRMRDFEQFCCLALFGFVQRRRTTTDPDAWPEPLFADFLAEFGVKLDLVLKRCSSNLSLDMFDLVGRRVILSVMSSVMKDEERAFSTNSH